MKDHGYTTALGISALVPVRDQRPCPFCGDFNGALIGGSDDKPWEVYGIRCSFCGAIGPEASTAEEAIELWNSREWGT